MITVAEFESESKAAIAELDRRVKALCGKEIVCVSDYNDQPMGTSKPSLKGKIMKIAAAFVNDEGLVIIRPEGYRCYMYSSDFSLISDSAIIEESMS